MITSAKLLLQNKRCVISDSILQKNNVYTGGNDFMGNSFKKFLASTAIAAMMATAIVPAVSADELEESEFVVSHSFGDVNSRYEDAVGFLYDIGAAKGISKTEFGTYKNLTRGDAAVILAYTLGLDTENAPDAGFTDLNPRVEGAVNALVAEGIASGVTANQFKPHEPLSRGAMAKFLVEAFDLNHLAVETPFTDVAGVFAPYIEALYGAGITTGKTATSYGTHQEIMRGDFANLLFNTINFYFGYSPFVIDSVELIDSNTLSLHFEEAVHEDFTAEKIAEYAYTLVELPGEETLVLTPENPVLSEDRKTLTFDHEDLSGLEGLLYPDENGVPFDFKAPEAGKGSVVMEGQNSVEFDFAGETEADIILNATNGIANINGLQLTVADSALKTDAPVTILLKSTNVEAARGGEGKTWGTFTHFNNGVWNLVDAPAYDAIPAGNYVLEAQFEDNFGNATTLTMNITVQ